MAQRAPGKHYRKGISLMKLFEMFPDDETAEQWFVEARWPDGIFCPYCDSKNVNARATHKTMPYRCNECKKRFSVKTDSVMYASNIGYQKWAIAIYLVTTSLKGVSSMKLHRDLGITQKAAWHMLHRIRKAYMETNDEPFDGEVEVDRNLYRRQRGEQTRQQEIERWPRHCWQNGGRRHEEPGNKAGDRRSCVCYRQRDVAGIRAGKYDGRHSGLHR